MSADALRRRNAPVACLDAGQCVMGLHPDVERVALLGWHLYPATRSKSRAGCIKNITQSATCDLDQLERWQFEFPLCNWRVVMGKSKIWGVDIDAPVNGHKNDGIAAFTEIISGHEPLPEKPMTRSGGGGYAIFFRHNGEPIIGESGKPKPGLDPKRGALTITIPPSIHHITGKPYRWLTAPWDVNPPDAPKWLLDIFRPPPEAEYKSPKIIGDDRARRILIRAVDAIRSSPSGAANDTLNRRAHYIARCVAGGALSEVEAVNALFGAAMDRRIPRSEAKATLKSAFKAGWKNPIETWSNG